MQSSKLIETLVGDQHLTKGIEPTGATPGFLDGFDVFAFCNGGAETVWHTKLTDKFRIVFGSMLAWK